jgi:hypothetical protein
MDETKGAIFGGGWAFILYQLVAWLGGWQGNWWSWVIAILLLAAGAAAGYFIGKQMSS